MEGDVLVNLPKMNPEATGPTPTSPRSFWNTVLTATPVFLTVLATILAGLSSRELTLSQYYRSLAAQNQSKAGDQWSLFQAKRSRRTNHENTVDLLQLRAAGSRVDAAALEAHANSLRQRVRKAEIDASRLPELIGKVKGDLGGSVVSLQQAAMQLQQTIRELTQRAETARNRMQEVLAHKGVDAVWAALNSDARPWAPISQPEAAWIQQARQVIQARQPEEENASLFRGIPEEELRKALATAEANIQAVEQVYEPVSETLGQITQVVEEQIHLARRFQRAVHDVEAGAFDLQENVHENLTDVRASIGALTRSARLVKSAVDTLQADFKTSWHVYHARRYKEEADYNRQAAEMYEIQVRRNSSFSERHRDRSKNFFYGMLAAQAGVTIATFSLAVKHKSVLWGLASLAGIGAILFGVYVQLYT
jgi:hypothetical protein